MVFQVPASKASIKQNRFEFELPDEPGKVYSVPKLRFIKPELIAGIETKTKLRAMLDLLNEYHPEISTRIEDGDQMGALYEAWAEASGISLGESSASTGS